jgi:hypothetical protein
MQRCAADHPGLDSEERRLAIVCYDRKAMSTQAVAPIYFYGSDVRVIEETQP